MSLRRFPFVLASFAILFSCTSCPIIITGEGWTRDSQPVFRGFYNAFAADASVIRVGEEYRMYYTEYDPKGEGPEDDSTGISLAVSSDASNWTIPNSAGATRPPFLAEGTTDPAEQKLETNCCVQWNGEYLLYYCGYPLAGYEVYPGNVVHTMGASIFLARSTDGLSFTRTATNPVLVRTPGWYDEDSVLSPSIIEHDGGLFMVYTGHRYDLSLPSGVYILGASSPDGVVWTKLAEPLLRPSLQLPASDPASAYEWMINGTAESELVVGPDGRFYLFFTGIDDVRHTRSIGLASADAPEGPYTILPDPILRASWLGFDAGAVIAPDVLFEGDRVRLWYNGMGRGESSWLIGYAEHLWPLSLE